MLGAMAEVTITKSENETYISKASVTPIVTHYEGGSDYHYAVYLLSDYSEKLAKKHGVRLIEQDSPFSYAYLKKLSKKVLGAEKEIEILNPKEMN